MKSPNIVLNRVKTLIKACRKELIHWFFPSYCLHCLEEEVETPSLFCCSCRNWIERFPLEECLSKVAVAVEKEGLTSTLLRERSGSFKEEVILIMASFMALQMIELKWPLPSVIIPSPNDPTNILLAQELSRFFQVPIKKCLKTENKWKKKPLLSEDRILFVELKLSFSRPFEILEEAAPLMLFYIGFCKK